MRRWGYNWQPFVCHRQSNPNYQACQKGPSRSREREIQRYKTEQGEYQTGLSSIHTDAVTYAIKNYNRRHSVPPFIAAEERRLLNQGNFAPTTFGMAQNSLSWWIEPNSPENQNYLRCGNTEELTNKISLLSLHTKYVSQWPHHYWGVVAFDWI